ncbi:MAG TPA: cytochrome P450 [Chthoniobacterales bacterium]|nr:cytochrome P450 [Chthoniobacterales bacterium]
MTPTYLGKLSSLPILFGIATNPLATTRRLHRKHGPYVLLHYPHSRPSRPQMLGCIADAELYRTMYSNLDAWRGVNVAMRAFKNHAASRLSLSMTRLRGARHAHYRRLISLPLSKPAVAAMSPDMATVAQRHVQAWPRGEAINVMLLTEHLMQDLSIKLLFGDDHKRALPIARKISYAAAASWPFPGRAYWRWLRTAPKLEVEIMEWAAQKHGEIDPKDILSILVNNPDERGEPATRELIGSILIFTFGATYETCQNALNWTLLLLSQHRTIAIRLAEEIDEAVAGAPPSMDKIGELPLLDGVLKESMRLFPPIPIGFRRSLSETNLGDIRVPPGLRVLASAYLINRNPEIYRDPSRFHPERWLDLQPSPYDYTVFGAGGRMCPGAAFGTQMAKIALAAILSRYRIELAAGTRINHRTTITLSPSPALRIIFRDKTTMPVAVPFAGTVHELVDLPAAM